MNLNNEEFFTAMRPQIECSGTFDFNQLSPFKYKKLYNTCEYCHSDVEMQAVRCSNCGASKNTYRIRERNYNE